MTTVAFTMPTPLAIALTAGVWVFLGIEAARMFGRAVAWWDGRRR